MIGETSLREKQGAGALDFSKIRPRGLLVNPFPRYCTDTGQKTAISTAWSHFSEFPAPSSLQLGDFYLPPDPHLVALYD